MKNMEVKHQQDKASWERKQQELDSGHQSTISSLKKEISMLKKQNMMLNLERLLEIEDHLKTFQLIKRDLESKVEISMDRWLF